MHQDREGLSTADLIQIFQITENYLFRRNICDVPTNALNKVFLNLNREVIRYGNSTDDYVNKFVYVLLSKRESSRFPDDDEFIHALTHKSVYQMRGRYKTYLFERFENYGTLETKDVYTHLDNGTYSIEHIMPQHLTPAWQQSLGPRAEVVHTDWLHRLGNLTLTAYNAHMSNATFQEKRDAVWGYRQSGLRMNQRLANKDYWGEAEIAERNAEMVDRAAKIIWSMPTTSFIPAVREFDSCSLGDEELDLKGRDIFKYSYQGAETPVASWADMYEHVVKFLHAGDKSILFTQAAGTGGLADLSSYFNRQPDKMHRSLKIDEGLYIEKNTSTTTKVMILRKLFDLFQDDPADLVFYLRDCDQIRVSDDVWSEQRVSYWNYALPVIRATHEDSSLFARRNPAASNWIDGVFGISGFAISCGATSNGARVALSLNKDSQADNKAAFDYLETYREYIEKNLGVCFDWWRNTDKRSSRVSYGLSGVSVTNEEDWPRMAKFQAEWSKKMLDVVVPLLWGFYGAHH